MVAPVGLGWQWWWEQQAETKEDERSGNTAQTHPAGSIVPASFNPSFASQSRHTARTTATQCSASTNRRPALPGNSPILSGPLRSSLSPPTATSSATSAGGTGRRCLRLLEPFQRALNAEPEELQKMLAQEQLQILAQEQQQRERKAEEDCRMWERREDERRGKRRRAGAHEGNAGASTRQGRQV